MPRKKKKYNARFPPARIKKIMQLDEDVGKVAAAVPVVISKALEIFVESLLIKSLHQTQGRNARTMSTTHIKQCIQGESTFDFLKDLVDNVPDMPCDEEENSQPPADHRAERKHKQHKPRRKSSKDDAAGPSGVRFVKQSSEEPSSSEEDSETDDGDETCNSDSNSNLHDPTPAAAAATEAAASRLTSAALLPGFSMQGEASTATTPGPATMDVCPTPMPSVTATGQLGMAVYRPKNNSMDDDENYDT